MWPQEVRQPLREAVDVVHVQVAHDEGGGAWEREAAPRDTEEQPGPAVDEESSLAVIEEVAGIGAGGRDPPGAGTADGYSHDSEYTRRPAPVVAGFLTAGRLAVASTMRNAVSANTSAAETT